MALALTTTFLFGLIFIYLQGYTFVYGDYYELSPVPEGATFLVAILGGFVAFVTQPLQNYLYRRSAASTSNGKPQPEARLYTACFSVWMLLISIFWFAFTSSINPKTVSYQVPMWSGVLFGYAEVAIYTGLWQYGTDAYGNNACCPCSHQSSGQWGRRRSGSRSCPVLQERGEQMDPRYLGFYQYSVSGSVVSTNLEGSMAKKEEPICFESGSWCS